VYIRAARTKFGTWKYQCVRRRLFPIGCRF
jgi:hypothetical protein